MGSQSVDAYQDFLHKAAAAKNYRKLHVPLLEIADKANAVVAYWTLGFFLATGAVGIRTVAVVQEAETWEQKALAVTTGAMVVVGAAVLGRICGIARRDNTISSEYSKLDTSSRTSIRELLNGEPLTDKTLQKDKLSGENKDLPSENS